MNDAEVDRRLRRASDEVLATVVRSAEPPPLRELDRRRPVRMALTLATAVIAVVGGIALAHVRGADDAGPRAATEPGTPASLAPPVTVTAGELCGRVADVARALEEPPTDVDTWADLGVQIETIENQLTAVDLADDDRRAITRFIDLAGRAVELGSAGGHYPARVPADDAVAVAADLSARFDDCSTDSSQLPTPLDLNTTEAP